jgi:hypothetical protein
MENRLIVPLSLAAVALGQSGDAGAGAIQGLIIFPGQQVPSMTVFAAELDSSRVHSVQLARGQADFTVEVPAGRYVVFLAPNETGAPDVYGAYTQYSLCEPHDVEGKCEAHALIPVTVSAKAPRPAVRIDDWYLTDTVAEQIERIRGAAGGGAARLESEADSAPRFSEYPSESYESSTAPKIDFAGTPLSVEDRELVQRALSNGPNFAGHLTAALTRCGAGCGRLVLVDWRSGQLQEPAPLAEIQGTLPCRTDEALLFRRDSRLMSVSRARGTVVVTQYYVWNQNNSTLVQSGEYKRASPAFCEVAGALGPIMR